MDFNFFMPVRTISGTCCFERGADELKRLGNRCLIVTGKSSAKKSGALAAAVTVLDSCGIEYVIFDGIGPNPLLSACCGAGAAARKCRADFIFGIGGGSPLDAAKAAAVFAANPSIAPMDIFGGRFSKALPLALAGTTAGTGSEVTSTAVLTIDAQNIKKSVTHPACYAAIAFCNPLYTFTCSYPVTVSTALDALCHAVEGYFSARAGDISRAAALEAVRLLWPNIVSLYNNPDKLPLEAAREELYYGSLWAGITLNHTGTGFPHPAGYALTTDFGIPHGTACAVFLSEFVRHNAPAAPSLTVKLLGALGCGMNEFLSTVADLSKTGIRLDASQCEKYAKMLDGRKNLDNAVNPSTVSEIQAVYEKLFLF